MGCLLELFLSIAEAFFENIILGVIVGIGKAVMWIGRRIWRVVILPWRLIAKQKRCA